MVDQYGYDFPGNATGQSVTVTAGQNVTGIDLGVVNTIPNPYAASISGPGQVAEGQTVTLLGSGQLHNVEITGFEWDLDYDGTTFNVDASGYSLAFGGPSLDGPATRTIAGRSVDSNGRRSDIAIFHITVLSIAPTAIFETGTATVRAGQTGTVGFSGMTDVAADSVVGFRYSYDFDNDGTFDVVSATGAGAQTATVPAAFLSTAGTHVIRGRIQDKDGAFTDYTTQINVTSNAAPTTLQAEAATLTGGTSKQTNHANYTGAGFADYGGDGSAVQFLYNATAAGTATLSFRYANGGSSARPLTIIVNGTAIGTISGTSTGSWDTWQNFSISANVVAGSNTIKAVAGAATGGNLDSMTITPTGGTPVTPPSPTSVFIDAGGPAAGSFSSDSGFAGGKTANYTAAVDTTLVSNPAPQAVYQSERYDNFTYTIANLMAGQKYDVRLDFVENYWAAAGKRSFNVTANGSAWLSNFDIYAAAGVKNKAVARILTVTADTSGKITLGFTSLIDNAKVNAISVTPNTAPVTPPVSTSVSINAGGSASGSFAADGSFSGGSTYKTTAAIDTSGVSNASPQSVYQTERFGNFTYTIANLVAGQQYSLSLDFAELYWSAAGQRLFNVNVNGSTWLSSFDIYAAAGAKNKAVRRTLTVTADTTGTIKIAFTGVKDNAKVSGISLVSLGT